MTGCAGRARGYPGLALLSVPVLRLQRLNSNTTTNAHSSQIYFALCTFDTDTPLSSLACKYSALLPCLDTNSALFSPGAADAYTAPSSVPLHPSSFTTSSILLT